jgi:hypothetical protein
MPFVDSTGRIDLDCIWCGENLLCDTAIVSQERHSAQAAQEPGGAATAYEQVKHDKYGAAAQRTNPSMKIMPLVWDTFGAAGKTAEQFASRVARAAANRFDLNQSRVICILRERLAARVVYGLAAIGSEAMWRIEAESALPVLRVGPHRTVPSRALHTATAQQSSIAQDQQQPPNTVAVDETGPADNHFVGRPSGPG